MDDSTARHLMNKRLQELAARRARALAEVARDGVEIGATANFLREQLGQPKARSAEFAELSASHMTELMHAANRESVIATDPRDRIQILRGPVLQSLVAGEGGVQRIIASQSEANPFWLSGLSPEKFERSGGRLRLPHMLIQTFSGEWVGVDNVNVGYLGTGPSNAIRELEGLGVDPETAEAVARATVSDTVLDTPGAPLVNHEGPNVWLVDPQPVGDFYVVVVPVGISNVDSDFDEVELGAGSQRILADWLKKLDDPDCPKWLRGTRRGRVYLDREAAARDGFMPTTATLRTGVTWDNGNAYPVIIEQGRLQLWLDIPTSNDPLVLFTPEIYAALEQAGFYTADYHARDSRHMFWRWLNSLGTKRPEYVDLNEEAPLLHKPPMGSQ